MVESDNGLSSCKLPDAVSADCTRVERSKTHFASEKFAGRVLYGICDAIWVDCALTIYKL